MPDSRSGGRPVWRSVALLTVAALLGGTVPGLAAHQEVGQRPLWEVGMAAGWSKFATYPGSARHRVAAAGVPWFVYRGERVRASGRSVRLVLFETPRSWADVAGGGWIPVNSATEPLRQGMPDLDAVFELGPRLNYRLFPNRPLSRTPSARRTDVVARLAVGSAWSAAALNDTSHRGYVVEPSLRVTFHPAGPAGATQWDARLYAEWADAELNRYYYGVAPSFAAPGRPAWRASAGWRRAGVRLSFGWRIGQRWRVGAFVSPSVLPDPVRHSPLVARNSTLTVGAGLTWAFARSRQMAKGPAADDNREP
ncbi:MAG: MipA/OmpV family protein [Nitrospirota bacterium]|nr:MipA/OmpV family protein [Nitrospirota bacterium]